MKAFIMKPKFKRGMMVKHAWIYQTEPVLTGIIIASKLTHTSPGTYKFYKYDVMWTSTKGEIFRRTSCHENSLELFHS